MALTAKQRQALEIVRDHPGLEPAQFSRLMWPDSEGHQHHTKCGPKGTCRGGGMRLAAGGYLGKLVKAGLVERYFGELISGFYLSKEGKRQLEEKDDAAAPPVE